MQVAQSGHRHSVHENFRFGYVCMIIQIFEMLTDCMCIVK